MRISSIEAYGPTRTLWNQSEYGIFLSPAADILLSWEGITKLKFFMTFANRHRTPRVEQNTVNDETGDSDLMFCACWHSNKDDDIFCTCLTFYFPFLSKIQNDPRSFSLLFVKNMKWKALWSVDIVFLSFCHFYQWLDGMGKSLYCNIQPTFWSPPFDHK